MNKVIKKLFITLAVISASFIFSYNSLGEELPITTEDAINTFKVTVPMELSLSIDEEGNSMPMAVTIDNNSSNTIKISNISAIPNSEWTLVEFDKDFSNTTIDTKEIGFNIFNNDMPISGILDLDIEPEIPANSNISLEYLARIPCVTVPLECEPLSIVFTFVEIPIDESSNILIPTSNIVLYVGDTYNFNYAISNKSNPNPDIADIDDAGLITALSVGTTEVVINDGNQIIFITVMEKEIIVPPEEIIPPSQEEIIPPTEVVPPIIDSTEPIIPSDNIPIDEEMNVDYNPDDVKETILENTEDIIQKESHGEIIPTSKDSIAVLD